MYERFLSVHKCLCNFLRINPYIICLAAQKPLCIPLRSNQIITLPLKKGQDPKGGGFKRKCYLLAGSSNNHHICKVLGAFSQGWWIQKFISTNLFIFMLDMHAFHNCE